MTYPGVEDIRALIERCNEDELSDGDLAILSSGVMQLNDLRAITVLLDEGIECEALAIAALEKYNERAADWPTDAMIKLTEALLFHGRGADADALAALTMQREPNDPYVVRLWASCADTPERVVYRFIEAMQRGTEVGQLLKEARDYISRNDSPGLEQLFNQATAELGGVDE